MSRKTNLWLIAAAVLIVLGLILFTGTMSANHWDFSGLSTVKYVTSTHPISEEFDSIQITSDTADILFVPSEDGICTVECHEEENVQHTVSVENSALVIGIIDNRAWYNYIGISFDTPKITVYLPEAQCGALIIRESTGDIDIPKDFQFESIDISTSTGDVRCYADVSEAMAVHTDTGDIRAENASVKFVDLSVSTGHVTAKSVSCDGTFSVRVSTGRTELSDVTCKQLYSAGSTGDIRLYNVVAKESFSIERSTGDVTFDSCDAEEISVRTDTGDVRGSLLSEKIFMAQTDTGRVSVPHTTAGGVCEITTDTGNIEITIE